MTKKTRKKSTVKAQYDTIQFPRSAGALEQIERLTSLIQAELSEESPGTTTTRWGAVLTAINNEIHRRERRLTRPTE